MTPSALTDGHALNVLGNQLSRRQMLELIGASAGAILASACTAAPQQTTPSSTTAASASGQPKSGGVLRAISTGDISRLDGHYYSTKWGLSAFIVFDTLTAYDDNLKPQPQLAESWDQSNDGKQISVTLRKGVQFHTGRELTSDDVIFNLNRILDPKVTGGPLTGFVPPETTWTTKDKHTFVLTAKQPWPAVFDLFQVFNIIDKETAEGPDASAKAVGTGPFKFVEWVQGDHVTYTKNNNYWQSGRPYLDGVVLNITKDAQAQVAQFEAGSADFCLVPPLRDFDRLKADPKYRTLVSPNPAGFFMFQPNVTKKPFDDKRVRQALNYAIDRKRIVDITLLGVGQPQALPWPPNSPAAESTKNDAYAFNLDKAKALLSQAGVGNLSLDLLTAPSFSPAYGPITEIYQSALSSIGVKLNIMNLELAAMLDAVRAKNYDMYLLSETWANMEPVTLYTTGGTTNYRTNQAGFKDDQYSQLVTSAASEPDATKRKQLYSQLNDLFLDASFEMPISPDVQTRALTTANVHDVGHRRNDMFTFSNAWLG